VFCRRQGRNDICRFVNGCRLVVRSGRRTVVASRRDVAAERNIPCYITVYKKRQTKEKTKDVSKETLGSQHHIVVTNGLCQCGGRPLSQNHRH
jgi:hypothetical protein